MFAVSEIENIIEWLICCNCLPKFCLTFLLQYFANLSKVWFFLRKYTGGIEAAYCSVTLYSLKSCNWLPACSFSYVCPPLSEKQATCRENPSNISCKQMNTCAQLATTLKNENQTLYGKEACQPSTHIACQVQMWRALRFFLTAKPLLAIETENKTLLLFSV